MIKELQKITYYGELRLTNRNTIAIDWYKERINQSVMEKITEVVVENKPEIIQILKRLKTDEYINEAIAQAISLEYSPVIEYGGEELLLYKQLIPSSFLYIQYINDIWVVYKSDYRDSRDRGKITSSRDIIKTPSLLQAIHRAEKYKDNYINFINNIKNVA